MSNFIRRTKNPATGEFENASWIDHGWRGQNAGYEVIFPSGQRYRQDAFNHWEFDDSLTQEGEG